MISKGKVLDLIEAQKLLATLLVANNFINIGVMNYFVSFVGSDYFWSNIRQF
jgi:hypothetical protein